MNNHWKNCAPEETVNKIEKILQDLGIDLCVEWMVDHNPLQVYSNKISIFNQSPNLKTGGKGITPNYAKASGYAEFIERLQTFMLFYRDYDITVFKDEEYDNEIQSCICPFLNLYTGEVENLPSYMSTHSTGMAAGNTDKEAIVHAICEIVERQTILDFINGNLQVNKQLFVSDFKFNFTALEKLFDGRIRIFDVGRFGIPTVAIICENQYTKQLFFKIDCGPTLDLAVERCITEFFQYNNFNNLSAFYWMGETPSSEVSFETLFSIIIDYNMGPIPRDLFNVFNSNSIPWGKTDYPIASENDIIITFLNACRNEYKYSEVFLRDFKWAGFPTVDIYIPDLSEHEHHKHGMYVFTDAFNYCIYEYNNYRGLDSKMIEYSLHTMLEKYLCRVEPVLIDNHKQEKCDDDILLLTLYEKCKDFSMDITHFKDILSFCWEE